MGLGELPNVARQMGSAAGVILRGYKTPRAPTSGVHHYVKTLEENVLRGQAALRECMEMRKAGFVPDLIVVHAGWGDALYLREAFPRAKIIGYCEFYYHGRGVDVGFDPEFPASLDNRCEVETKNATQLLSWANFDKGWSPTAWQASLFPESYRARIEVVHEGVDTQRACPDPAAVYTLPNGRILSGSDEVLTIVNRNMEPYRGFHVFMRTLPEIQKRRPKAVTIIIGSDDDVAYGNKPKNGKTWREVILDEVGDRLDMSRVHFVGTLGFDDYLSVLRVSSAHVYMTYPYILSWSVIEAMAAQCLVVGSNTPSVAEVIRHGENGCLFDFFDRDALADQVEAALAQPGEFKAVRHNARRTALEQFDLASVCLPKQVDLLQRTLEGC